MLPEHCTPRPGLPPARVEGLGGCVLRAEEQGSSHWDGAGSGQSWCSDSSAYSNICSKIKKSSQERVLLKLIKGRGKKVKKRKKTSSNRKSEHDFLKSMFSCALK